MTADTQCADFFVSFLLLVPKGKI